MRSPSSRTGAGLVALVLAAFVAVGAVPPETTIRVAQDGSGDFEAITAAIEAASEGDTIVVGPGTYVENLLLDRDLRVVGDGDREDVVLVFDRATPIVREVALIGDTSMVVYGENADVALEHLTIVSDGAIAVVLTGGSSTIRDIVADGYVGVREDAAAVIEGSDLGRVGLVGPNESMIRDNTVRDRIWASEGSRGVVEGNLVLDEPIVIDSGAHLDIVGNSIRPRGDAPGIVVEDQGSSVVARGNDIAGGRFGVLAYDGTTVEATDNTIEVGGHGILVELPTQALITGNAVSGGIVGILTVEASVVRDNIITAASEAGLVAQGDGLVIEGNTVIGGRIGLHYERPKKPLPPRDEPLDGPSRIEGNEVSDASYFGVVIDYGRPLIRGNSICAERQPLLVRDDATPVLGTNDICENE